MRRADPYRQRIPEQAPEFSRGLFAIRNHNEPIKNHNGETACSFANIGYDVPVLENMSPNERSTQ